MLVVFEKKKKNLTIVTVTDRYRDIVTKDRIFTTKSCYVGLEAN